jgi:signal transduction histidine kinase
MSRRPEDYDGRMRSERERVPRAERTRGARRAPRPISPELLERVQAIGVDPRLAGHLGRNMGDRRREQTAEQRQHADVAAAVVLTVLTWLEIAAFIHIPWVAALFSRVPTPGAGVWPYVVAAGCFLPLVWRERWPGPAFLVVSAFTIIYMAMPWPPAIVLVGPWLALYAVGSRYGGSRAVPLAIVVVGVSLGISAVTVSQSLSVLQAVGMFALLAVAGALGNSVRTRTQLFDEIRRAHDEADRRRIDDERLRIAREVHDIMAHSLTLMTVQADAGAASFDNQPERAREALDIIGDTGRSTLKDLRSMLDVLTAGEEDSPRAPVADLTRVPELIESVREAGLGTTLSTEGEIGSVPTVVAVAAYRIVQESLTNAVRHSGAAAACVILTVQPDGLEIEVTDDGHAGADAEFEPGRGIRGMRERVVALGGTFEAGPVPHGGFRVQARIPFPRSV